MEPKDIESAPAFKTFLASLLERIPPPALMGFLSPALRAHFNPINQ